jgi:hypothetical protein
MNSKQVCLLFIKYNPEELTPGLVVLNFNLNLKKLNSSYDELKNCLLNNQY